MYRYMSCVYKVSLCNIVWRNHYIIIMTKYFICILYVRNADEMWMSFMFLVFLIRFFFHFLFPLLNHSLPAQ